LLQSRNHKSRTAGLSSRLSKGDWKSGHPPRSPRSAANRRNRRAGSNPGRRQSARLIGIQRQDTNRGRSFCGLRRLARLFGRNQKSRALRFSIYRAIVSGLERRRLNRS
jgi:hypothetical protein